MSINIAQHVLEGESFTTTTDFVQISTTDEHPFLLIKNPAGSKRRILFTHFNIGLDESTSNSRSTMRCYLEPTVTDDGTVLPSVNNCTAASDPSASACYIDPTVSDNGDKVGRTTLVKNNPSKGYSRFYVIDPGSSLLITVQNEVTNKDTFVDAYWIEIGFKG